MGKEFKCEHCGGTFETTWSEEEADEEMKQMFGDVPKEEQAVICDDCYKAMMSWYAAGASTN